MDGLNFCPLRCADVHPAMEVFCACHGVFAEAVETADAGQPGKVKGISKRLTVPVGLHIEAVPCGFLPGVQTAGNDGGERTDRECRYQHIPGVGTPVLICARLPDYGPGQSVLPPEQCLNIRFDVVKFESIVFRGQIGEQFKGIVGYFSHVVAVLVIAGMIGLRLVNVNL